MRCHRLPALADLPQRALLGLEAERRQRAVVCSRAPNATREQLAAVRQQVGGHEGAVGVAADGDAWVRGIHHPPLLQLLGTARQRSEAETLRWSPPPAVQARLLTENGRWDGGEGPVSGGDRDELREKPYWRRMICTTERGVSWLIACTYSCPNHGGICALWPPHRRLPSFPDALGGGSALAYKVAMQDSKLAAPEASAPPEIDRFKTCSTRGISAARNRQIQNLQHQRHQRRPE
jgi:hypothetical protein